MNGTLLMDKIHSEKDLTKYRILCAWKMVLKPLNVINGGTWKKNVYMCHGYVYVCVIDLCAIIVLDQ